jgi:exosortase
MTNPIAGAAPKLHLDIRAGWPLVVGFAALAVPAFFDLAQKSWSYDDNAQGPILLATGSWLLMRELGGLKGRGQAGSIWLSLGILALALLLYVAGRALDFITVEAAGLYLAGLAMLQASYGARPLLAIWFPLLYLAFAVPLPSNLVAEATEPLKHFVAYVATGLLSTVGLPVSREGVTITVAQYQLLVEDACSGMNSIIGLTAISLLYIFLRRRATVAYTMLMVCFAIPVAIVANIIRVITLILITYAFGDEVGQSFIHQFAGLLLFGAALALIFLTDNVLFVVIARLLRRR